MTIFTRSIEIPVPNFINITNSIPGIPITPVNNNSPNNNRALCWPRLTRCRINQHTKPDYRENP